MTAQIKSDRPNRERAVIDRTYYGSRAGSIKSMIYGRVSDLANYLASVDRNRTRSRSFSLHTYSIRRVSTWRSRSNVNAQGSR